MIVGSPSLFSLGNRMNAIVIGCGYLGARVAAELAARGYDVHVTSRSEEKIERLAHTYTAHRLDLATMGHADALFETRFDVAVYAVAPGRGGDADLAFREGPGHCLQLWGERSPGMFVFLSSTGVYSQDDGSWVDESTPPAPATERQQRLVSAEDNVLTQRDDGGNTCAVRLGGLYGPDRSPVAWCQDPQWRERLARGNAEAFMNWIHVDDAAAAVSAAAERARAGEVYLAVDGTPITRRDFYGRACELAGVAPLDLESNPALLGKRCSAAKAREELGFEPRWPSAIEGLAAR